MSGPPQRTGAVLDQRYRIERLLGSGGSSTVYCATDLKCGHQVAIKIAAEETDQTGYALFAAEGMTASRVNHPNAAAIYDIGKLGNRPYLVMELAPGVSLASLIERAPLEPGRAAAIAAQVLDALAAAHQVGIVHCDLSSQNIIVDSSNDALRIKVIDFGLARSRSAASQARVVGTVEYLAPEQLRRAKVEFAADVYAVGILLYEMIVGRTPFAGGTREEVAYRQLHEVPARIDTFVRACPSRLADLCERALAKEPKNRPSSAVNMRRALRASVVTKDRSLSFEPRQTTVQHGRLIDRDEALSKTVDVLRAGRGALALVGPEGIGRKRLLAEVQSSVAPNIRLLIATPPLTVRGDSWSAVLDLLSSALGLGTVTLANLRAAVARVGLPERDVPGLAELFGVGDGRDFERGLRAAEASASIRRVFAAVGRQSPRTAIAFTDVERLDEPSRRVALDLAANAKLYDIAVVITGIGVNSEICPTVELKPLDSKATRDLLSAWRSGDEDAVLSRTNGTPAHLEQLIGWLDDGHEIEEVPTESVDIIAARVHRIPADDRLLLQALACFGGTMSRHQIRTLGLRFVASERFGLLHQSESGIALHSAIVARVVLATTPAGVRSKLHEQALEALGDRSPPAARGNHAVQAGRLELSYSMFMKAGLDAFSRFDNHGAVEFYLRAAGVARQSAGVSADRQLASATIFAAEALIDDDRPEPAFNLLEELGDELLEGTLLAALQRSRGLAHLALGRATRGRSCLDAAIAAALVPGDLELVCDCYLELANSFVAEGDTARAREELEQAIAVTSGGSGWSNASAPKRLWRIGYRLAEIALGQGDKDAARRVSSEALALARRRSSLNGQARLAALLAGICESQGDFGSALRYRANAIKILGALGDRRSTAELLLSSTHFGSESESFGRTLAAEIGWKLESQDQQ